MKQLQFKNVARQAIDKEYLAFRIKITCILIADYINKKVSKNYKISPTEVFKDFKNKDQLRALLVIGNYLDKKLHNIYEQEDEDNSDVITLDSAKVLKALNAIMELREGGDK